mgnify:CR=1 FL=1
MTHGEAARTLRGERVAFEKAEVQTRVRHTLRQRQPAIAGFGSHVLHGEYLSAHPSYAP